VEECPSSPHRYRAVPISPPRCAPWAQGSLLIIEMRVLIMIYWFGATEVARLKSVTCNDIAIALVSIGVARPFAGGMRLANVHRAHNDMKQSVWECVGQLHSEKGVQEAILGFRMAGRRMVAVSGQSTCGAVQQGPSPLSRQLLGL